jgi:hypothetical protein
MGYSPDWITKNDLCIPSGLTSRIIMKTHSHSPARTVFQELKYTYKFQYVKIIIDPKDFDGLTELRYDYIFVRL